MQRSDNIRSFIFGPWVGQLCNTFEEIDQVRREGGFKFSFRGTHRVAIDQWLDRFAPKLPDIE